MQCCQMFISSCIECQEKKKNVEYIKVWRWSLLEARLFFLDAKLTWSIFKHYLMGNLNIFWPSSTISASFVCCGPLHQNELRRLLTRFSQYFWPLALPLSCTRITGESLWMPLYQSCLRSGLNLSSSLVGRATHKAKVQLKDWMESFKTNKKFGCTKTSPAGGALGSTLSSGK